MKIGDKVSTKFGEGEIIQIEEIYRKQRCAVKIDELKDDLFQDKTMWFWSKELKEIEK